MKMMFAFLFRSGGREGWERGVEERGCIYNKAKYLVGNYRETPRNSYILICKVELVFPP